MIKQIIEITAVDNDKIINIYHVPIYKLIMIDYFYDSIVSNMTDDITFKININK